MLVITIKRVLFLSRSKHKEVTAVVFVLLSESFYSFYSPLSVSQFFGLHNFRDGLNKSTL